MSAHDGEEDLSSRQLQAAEADLGRIRESLAAAARGDLDATEPISSLRGYLDQHGPALRNAASAVGEEVRRQLLEQLYRWRTQLDDQLSNRGRPVSEASEGSPEAADRSGVNDQDG